jgi:eukaryotic-like serine/threonine-protein kinase
MRPQPGDLIGGKYRIVRLIGDGGMGAVYEARHEVLGSPVALKFLHSELARRPGLASRFLQEARVSASIQSPHVTRVTDVDQTPDGSPFLVMELLGGESLQQLLDRRLKLQRDQAIDFALQILSGLEAAHALGVVHRDLKPDNVFITPSTGGPLLKLLDFGIAKLRQTGEYQKGLTRPGAVMGTPEYMAPEQLYAADRVDHRADIYSLGAMLYEMLAGARPAYGEDAPTIINQIVEGHVKPLAEHDPSIPPELARVVHKAIAADKADRFASAMDMRLALAPFAGQLSHAGRLAATPAPASVIPRPSQAPQAASTVDAAVPSGARGGVAPTLPPDDGAGAPAPTVQQPAAAFGIKGSTQEAPKDVLQQVATHMSPVAQPLVGGYPIGRNYATAAITRRKPKRALGAVIALALGAAVTGSVILVIAMRDHNENDQPTAAASVESSPPATTISAQAGPTTPTSQPTLPPPEPTATEPPSVASHPAAKHPAHKDSGATDAGGKPDASRPSPFPWALPPGLPGLPSALPSALPTAFPTAFPPIPGFSLPGSRPPPEGKGKKRPEQP